MSFEADFATVLVESFSTPIMQIEIDVPSSGTDLSITEEAAEVHKTVCVDINAGVLGIAEEAGAR
jgi:hypothetical protein